MSIIKSPPKSARETLSASTLSQTRNAANNTKTKNRRPAANSCIWLIFIYILCILVSFLVGCSAQYYLALAKMLTIAEALPHIHKQAHTATESSTYGRPSNFAIGGYAIEHIENIVHPAMLAHSNPVSVLIVGGTQQDAYVQAILTAVLKHTSVERVTVVASVEVRQIRDEVSSADGRLNCHIPSDTKTIVEYFDSLQNLQQLLMRNHSEQQSCQRQSSFDIVLLLHPFDLFSDIDSDVHVSYDEYFMELSSLASSTIHTLSQDLVMTKDGILVTHLGPSPHLNRKSKMQLRSGCDEDDCDENLQLKLIAHFNNQSNFKDMHIFEDANGPGAQTIRAPQSYVVLCKDPNCKRHWYADESFMNYQIRKRLSPPPLYVDGAMLQRYNRPPKAWESLYCSFPEHKRECHYMNGFDPAVPNVARQSFEVKPSSIGKNVGRGLFTKVDIAEGSYFMQEVSVHQVKFSVQSYSVIFDALEMLEDTYDETIGDDDDDDEEDEDSDDMADLDRYGVNIGRRKSKFVIDAVITYMDGYGYDVDHYGASGNNVDSGMNTFMNHGCNKTFNYGLLFYVFDRNAGVVKSDYEVFMLSEEEADPSNPPKDDDDESEGDLFNPLLDRHLDHYASSYEGSIADISKGQELFSNYVHYYGVDDDSWEYGIQDLRSQCRGEKIGTIVQIEGIIS